MACGSTEFRGVNYNLAPSEQLPIVRTSHSEGLKLQLARFGWVPSWARDVKVGYSMFNARSETLHEKPAFKAAYAKRRCIVPVAGFYEWKDENGKKQPYLFTRRDGEPLELAGLWDFAEVKGEKIFSFTIVTMPPTPLVAEFHDRMPGAVGEGRDWLDGEDPLVTMRPLPDDAYEVRAMNPAMNKPIGKNLILIEP